MEVLPPAATGMSSDHYSLRLTIGQNRWGRDRETMVRSRSRVIALGKGGETIGAGSERAGWRGRGRGRKEECRQLWHLAAQAVYVDVMIDERTTQLSNGDRIGADGVPNSAVAIFLLELLILHSTVLWIEAITRVLRSS